MMRLSKNTIMAIAGFDPTGGAGILLDSRVLSFCGLVCAGAITAIANQTHGEGMDVFPVPQGVFEESLKAAVSSGPAGVKIGMLANAGIAEAIAGFLGDLHDIPIVVDPVFRSSSGMALIDDAGKGILKSEILPVADVITPNWAEASELAGIKIEDIKAAKEAAKKLLDLFGVTVIVTGGHAPGNPVDILADGVGIIELPSDRIPGEFRGTGCAFSSAIAAELAKGKSIRRAVLSAKELLSAALEHSIPPYITFGL